MQQLIAGTYNQSFNKYFYDELVVGKLAHTEVKTAANKGDEITFLMPATASMFNYDGGELPNAEHVTNSTVKIRLDRIKAVHYKFGEFEKKIIENSPDLGQKINVLKEYANDATKQFAAALDCAYADLYTRAGVAVGTDAPIDLTTDDGTTIKNLLAYMRTKYQRGDNKGHNNWRDGQMVAILPPEVEMYLGKLEIFGNVESGHKKIEKGYVGRLEGWDIMVSNNIACSDMENGIFHPLFGIKGKTLAGGVGQGLKTVTYDEEKTFDSAVKGYGIYGVGAPRADLLGTATIKAPIDFTQFNAHNSKQN